MDSGIGFAALQLWALAWVCMGGSVWAPAYEPFHLHVIVLRTAWKLTKEVQHITGVNAESTVFVISRMKRSVSWTAIEISIWPLGCSVYWVLILSVLGETAVFLDHCISYFCATLLVTVFSSSAKCRCPCTNNFPEVFLGCGTCPVVILDVISGF